MHASYVVWVRRSSAEYGGMLASYRFQLCAEDFRSFDESLRFLDGVRKNGIGTCTARPYHISYLLPIFTSRSLGFSGSRLGIVMWSRCPRLLLRGRRVCCCALRQDFLHVNAGVPFNETREEVQNRNGPRISRAVCI
jgi:hypothetical protein